MTTKRTTTILGALSILPPNQKRIIFTMIKKGNFEVGINFLMNEYKKLQRNCTNKFLKSPLYNQVHKKRNELLRYRNNLVKNLPNLKNKQNIPYVPFIRCRNGKLEIIQGGKKL
jgi:hypothetical protein